MGIDFGFTKSAGLAVMQSLYVVSGAMIFNAEQNVTLPPYETSDQVCKFPVSSTTSKEYSLPSNRQRTLSATSNLGFQIRGRFAVPGR